MSWILDRIILFGQVESGECDPHSICPHGTKLPLILATTISGPAPMHGCMASFMGRNVIPSSSSSTYKSHGID